MSVVVDWGDDDQASASCSHWGMFEWPGMFLGEHLAAIVKDHYRANPDSHPWDTGEPSYDSRHLHGGQRSTYQRLNFGELS